jgi:hypothetical protein
MNSTMNLDEPKRAVIATKVYDILVELGGADKGVNPRFGFIKSFSEMLLEGRGEYRFSGYLGFGGKIWVNDCGTRIYVNQYREDETPESRKKIKEINEKLISIVDNFEKEIIGRFFAQ